MNRSGLRRTDPSTRDLRRDEGSEGASADRVALRPAETSSEPPRRWLSTEDAAREIGMSSWWIRERIEEGSLRAVAVSSGHRMVYRIAARDWSHFVRRVTFSSVDLGD